MLKRIEISGFRSCNRVVLDDLEKITALIGRNAAGKSNILKAIADFAQLACTSGTESRAWRDLDVWTDAELVEPHGFSVEADVLLSSRSYHYWLKAGMVVSRGVDKTLFIAPFLNERLLYTDSGASQELIFNRAGEVVHLLGTGDKLGVGQGVSTMSALASILPAEHQVLAITEPLRRFFSSMHYYPLDEPTEPANEPA